MNSITADASNNNEGEGEGGPMWSRFFDSFAAHDDEGSVLSGSHIPTDSLQGFPSSPARLTSHRRQSSQSEVHPDDSASAVNEPSHDLPPLPASVVAESAAKASTLPVDDGTYVFKFRTPSGRTHRFQARNDNYEDLVDIVTGKLATDPFFIPKSIPEDEEAAPAPSPSDFALLYTDSDGDTVLVTSDSDVADAVRIARSSGSDRVVLFLQGGTHWEEAGAGESDKKAIEAKVAAAETIQEVQKAEATSSALPDGGVAAPPPTHVAPVDDTVMGVPRDLILPASMGFLSVVIIGVFIASRMSKEY